MWQSTLYIATELERMFFSIFYTYRDYNTNREIWLSMYSNSVGEGDLKALYWLSCQEKVVLLSANQDQQGIKHYER